MAASKSKRTPKAVITLTVEGDQLNVALVFTPAAKTKGPIHPAYRAGLQMLEAFQKSRRDDK